MELGFVCVVSAVTGTPANACRSAEEWVGPAYLGHQ